MRLVSHPKPGELDQRCSKSRIAGFRNTLFAIDRSALPGRRCKARVSGDLSSVVEVSEEPFRPEDSGELGSDARNLEQHRRQCWRGGVFRGQQHIALGLHGFDLLEQQFEPVELTANLRLQMLRQRTAVAGLELFQALAPITAPRLVSGYLLGEKKPLDAVDVANALGRQRLALAAEASAVFLLGFGHLTIWLTSGPSAPWYWRRNVVLAQEIEHLLGFGGFGKGGVAPSFFTLSKRKGTPASFRLKTARSTISRQAPDDCEL